ncbi:hypothetical protein [Demequina soli]|uniref:hypothetical protein n=1 Tax=Demequina soli TaxID=1638987 RepID=UPI0007856818|nr:hypothetical protein [Demequina soli]
MRLSDALRGAADRAPLDGLEVDTRRVGRRVAAQRGLRTGSAGVVAAAMVGVVGYAAIAGGGGSAGSSADDAGGRSTAGAATDQGAPEIAPSTPEIGGDSAGVDGAAGAGGAAGTALAWGVCGSTLPETGWSDAPATLEASVGSDVAAGGRLDVSVTTVGAVDGTFETFGIAGVVLWDGTVVGYLGGDAAPAEAFDVTLASGVARVDDLTTPLVNCWDGAALPAGKYELVLTQEFAAVDATATEPSAGAGGSIAADAAVRAVADPVGFAIAGDAVADPFGAYLGGSTTDPAPAPDPTPDPGSTSTTAPDEPLPTIDPSALTAGTARDLYTAGLAGAWDMAPGTSRWIASGDSTGTVATAWFGCGSPDGFPARSSAMNLLDVGVDAPAAIDLSYGWVVDGNPEVTTTVTNASRWDLTGFWGKGSVQLVLVRDGRAVAEAYPVDPRLSANVGVAARAAGAADAQGAAGAAEPAIAIAPSPADGSLAAGESVASTLLWRDVTGCWSDAGQATVEPGDYTLLAMQYVSVGSVAAVAYDLKGDGAADSTLGSGDAVAPFPDAASSPDTASSSGSVSSGSTGSGTAIDGGTADPYDALDLQVWVSLGAVTVR